MIRPAPPHNDVPQASLLISPDDLATILKVSKRTLWRLLSGAKLPRPIHVGRSPRWRLEEINAWIEAGCPDLESWSRSTSE
ncbi:MAG: helix-turn-helix domain-containing protein [Pirellulales bacterium]|nr:helix-turn-helix domain-containing protein [Pirellulales bacterium]